MTDEYVVNERIKEAPQEETSFVRFMFKAVRNGVIKSVKFEDNGEVYSMQSIMTEWLLLIKPLNF